MKHAMAIYTALCLIIQTLMSDAWTLTTTQEKQVINVPTLSCGPACLYLAARLLGKSVAEEDLTKLNLTSESTSIYDLISAGEKLGLYTKCVRTSYKDLKALNHIAVIPVKNDHFILAVEYADVGVTTADPPDGPKRQSLEEFEAAWVDNIALLISDKPLNINPYRRWAIPAAALAVLVLSRRLIAERLHFRRR